MKKFLFVSVSKDENFMLKDEDFKDVSDIVDFKAISNNTTAITKVYNNILLRERVSKEHEYVVFMHSDVKFPVKSLIEKIERCENKYAMIGLCGCEKINVSQVPLNWFCGSRPFPEHRWGCVTHGEMNNKKSFFSSHHPEVENHEVACIDGLCIIFCKEALNSDIVFDERFMFDQYDTDISFTCVMKHKMKLGVVVEQELHHYSVGMSILEDEFLKHEVDFRKKWDFPIPENSKLSKFV